MPRHDDEVNLNKTITVISAFITKCYLPNLPTFLVYIFTTLHFDFNQQFEYILKINVFQLEFAPTFKYISRITSRIGRSNNIRIIFAIFFTYRLIGRRKKYRNIQERTSITASFCLFAQG